MLTVSSPNRYDGRLRPVRVAVLHTAQAPCITGRAEGVLRYLARPEVRASAHWCTDPDTTVAGVDEADTAWATPSVNADGIQIEQCGYAEFGSDAVIPSSNTAARQAYGTRWPRWEDADPQRMLRTQVVPLLVGVCRRHGLPPVLLEPNDLLAGRLGITDHHRCSTAYGGDHWDCGGAYPLAGVIDDVRRALGGASAPASSPAPQPIGDDVVVLIRHPDTGTLWWWDGQTRARVEPAAGVFATVDDLTLGLGRLVDAHPRASRWDDGKLWHDVPAHDLELIPER